MTPTPVAKAKRKHFLNIISLCCSNDPAKATKLLYDCSGEKAKNQEDLEHKIALIYRDSEDKIAIEKRLAEMHPDKDFILKYNKPKVVAKEEVVEVDKPKVNVDALSKTINEVEKATSLETASNCAGNPNCSCNHNASNFTSNTNSSNEQFQQQGKNDHTQLIIAAFGITAIFGMALIISNKR